MPPTRRDEPLLDAVAAALLAAALKRGSILLIVERGWL